MRKSAGWALLFLLTLCPRVGAEVHELAFPSGETSLRSLLHTPDDSSTDTLLIYLHGNPGRALEPESWLVDAMLDRGIAVFRFNYRGLWGNEGNFSLANGIGDLQAALDFVTDHKALQDYGVTPDRIFLFGYSFGTAVALGGAHDDDRIAGIVSLAPCDHGFFGLEFVDPESTLREFLVTVTEALFGEGGPIEQDAAIFVDDLVDHAETYRFAPTAGPLRDKKLLFLVGLDDEVCFAEDHFFPLYRALQSASHPATEVALLAMDHAMNPVGREAIASRLGDWVRASAKEDLSTVKTSNEKLQEFALSYTAAWNSGDPDEVARHYAERGTLAINGGEPAEGREALAGVAASFMTGFPDMVLIFDGLAFEEGRIQYRWTFRGTNTGPDGTGQWVDFSGHESWEFDEAGLIDNSLGNFDAEDYQRQLAGRPSD